MSIVRDNLMSRPGYSPYCGAVGCRFGMPRTDFDGEQFKCICGWRSSFDLTFIKQYKEKRRASGQGESGATEPTRAMSAPDGS